MCVSVCVVQYFYNYYCTTTSVDHTRWGSGRKAMVATTNAKPTSDMANLLGFTS